MTDTIYTLDYPYDSINNANNVFNAANTNFEDRKVMALVKNEVIHSITDLLFNLINQEDFIGDLAKFNVEVHGNWTIAEPLEFWIVTSWLGEQLKARGALVVEDFYGLTIWGRQISGQYIYMDSVIKSIAADC